MADAKEGTHAKTDASKGIYTSVDAALAAVEQGQPCLHLDLTKPSHEVRYGSRDQYSRLVSSKPMTPEELAELVHALPRLMQLQTLLLACTVDSTLCVVIVLLGLRQKVSPLCVHHVLTTTQSITLAWREHRQLRPSWVC